MLKHSGLFLLCLKIEYRMRFQRFVLPIFTLICCYFCIGVASDSESYRTTTEGISESLTSTLIDWLFRAYTNNYDKDHQRESGAEKLDVTKENSMRQSNSSRTSRQIVLSPAEILLLQQQQQRQQAIAAAALQQQLLKNNYNPSGTDDEDDSDEDDDFEANDFWDAAPIRRRIIPGIGYGFRSDVDGATTVGMTTEGSTSTSTVGEISTSTVESTSCTCPPSSTTLGSIKNSSPSSTDSTTSASSSSESSNSGSASGSSTTSDSSSTEATNSGSSSTDNINSGLGSMESSSSSSTESSSSGSTESSGSGSTESSGSGSTESSGSSGTSTSDSSSTESSSSTQSTESMESSATSFTESTTSSGSSSVETTTSGSSTTETSTSGSNPTETSNPSETTTAMPPKRPPYKANLECRCGTQTTRDAALGTIDAQVNLYPWIVSINSKSAHLCTGNIINSKFVLTSAACINGFTAQDLRIQSTLTSLNRTTYTVEKVHFHPAHKNNSMENNIALLEINEWFRPSKTVKFICLPIGDKMEQNSGITVTLAKNQNTKRLTLIQENVQEIQRSRCKTLVKRDKARLPKNSFCTAPPRKECQGDTGGSFITLGKGYSFVIKGLISYTTGCKRRAQPTVHTTVSKYLNWILFKTQKASYCREPDFTSELSNLPE